MSRSGYSYDYEHVELWRASVERAIKGKRGQAFLREMAAALDDMPYKTLISEELVSESGDCCALGAVCKARMLDVRRVDYFDPESVARLVGISRAMAAEIEYMNDEFLTRVESGEERWRRMRAWVANNIFPAKE